MIHDPTSGNATPATHRYIARNNPPRKELTPGGWQGVAAPKTQQTNSTKGTTP